MSMEQENLEHLSALVDGEIKRDTGRFLIKRLGADQELQGVWSRYHLIGDCLRNPKQAVAVENLSERVGLALSEEQKIPASASGSWVRPLASAAIAASVMVFAVIAVNRTPTGGPTEMNTLAETQPFVSPDLVSTPLQGGTVQASFAAGGQANQLNAYLLRHNQLARSAGTNGFVSYVPIVVMPETESAVEQAQSDEQVEENSVTQ